MIKALKIVVGGNGVLLCEGLSLETIRTPPSSPLTSRTKQPSGDGDKMESEDTRLCDTDCDINFQNQFKKMGQGCGRNIGRCGRFVRQRCCCVDK